MINIDARRVTKCGAGNTNKQIITTISQEAPIKM